MSDGAEYNFDLPQAKEREDNKPLTMVQAINAALDDELGFDQRVLLMGEDIGRLGGVFRVTDALLEKYGENRVLDTPLAESGIVGTAIGLAARGFKPVTEIQFNGFVFPAFNQITTQLSRQYMRNKVPMPVVIRIPHGGHIGAVEHHMEAPEAYFAHTPGLRMVSCAIPNDAYWMMRQAIRCPDPVIFFEPLCRYWSKGEVDYSSPRLGLHQAAVVRTGSDVTVLGHGGTVHTLLAAAEYADASVEVIDLRSLSPIDYETILASVKKTGRLVVAQEAPDFVSLGSEIAATVAEQAFYNLEAPVLRVSGYDVPFPPAKLEKAYLPDIDRVLTAIDLALSY